MMAAEASNRPVIWAGIPLKYLSLVTLIIQNSALFLIMHYSRIMPTSGGHRYFASTAVFLNEVIKLAFSFTMAFSETSSSVSCSTPATTMFRTVWASVFTGDSWKLAIPAMLYTLQNTLQYVAVSNLDAATFQVTYQLKIIATAFFSVLLLGRTLSMQKWASLLLLTFGVAVVQLSPKEEQLSLETLKQGQTRYHLPRTIEELRGVGSIAAAQLLKRSATYEGIKEDVALQHPQLDASIGLATVIMTCVISGFAGVYFEKILKDPNSKTSLWIRNIQLSFYALFPALFIGVIFKDGEDIARLGFFTGYNWVVWTAIVLQAMGGVIVALVVKYADNIAKNFATSISVLLSSLGSIFFFDFSISSPFLIGTSIVLFSTYLYSHPDRARPKPIIIVDYERTTIGDASSYFDDRSATLPTPSIKGEALSTSRPGTPTVERHPPRLGPDRKALGKRYE